MRLRLGGIAAAGAVLALLFAQSPAVSADTSTCGTAASSARCGAGGSTAYTALQSRLSGDVATALATQHRLAQAVSAAAAAEASLSAQLAADEARVTALQNQVAQLDAQIATLESKIEVERNQVSALARAMYERPATLLDLIASSGSLSDMLSQATDMLVAGDRAHALEEHLKSDLATAQADRDARQADLDQETATLSQVQDGLAQLSGVQTELDTLAGQMVTLISHDPAAAANVNEVPTDVSAQLASLLETQETNLAQQEEAAAWAQASVGAGLAANESMLPAGVGPSAGGIPMAWPMRGGVVTQPFGPTSFVLEPPLGQYAHFHTGIDVAAPAGTPVNAAAAGIVVVVAHTAVGYGNYVIVAHGYGVLTLYGHLLETDAYPGEVVTQGEQVGREGMTGWATGPHVHFEVRINGQFVNPARFLPPL